MRRVAFAALTLVAGLGLAGCTFFVHKSAPVIHPTPAPTSTPEVVVAVPNGVMASGSFRSPDGSTSGRFEIDNAGGRYTVYVSHVKTSLRTGIFINLADSSVTMSHCALSWQAQVGLGSVVHGKRSTWGWTLPRSVAGAGDPSYLSTLVVNPVNGTTASCDQPIIAVAPIAWRIPETHPNIHVVDHGVGYSAWGRATVRDGAPFTYLTHQGDDWTHIAQRFGITTGDLTWLNPVRIGGDAPQAAYIGQVLNLDPNNRGNSESRRHPE